MTSTSTSTSSSVITITLNPAWDKTVTVDEFVFGGLNRIQDIRTDAGGKGINVAKVLKKFQLDVTAWGLNGGFQGHVIQEKLKSMGIRTDFLEANGETRTNLKIIEQKSKQTTELNESGFSADHALLDRFIVRYQEHVGEASIVVLGGSLPPGTPKDYYKTLIEIGRAKGIPTVLDADGEALKHGIEAVPYAVKPNIHELELLFGRTFSTDEQIVSAARELIAKGIQYVNVSMGGKGSILVHESGAIRAKPFPITPLSTVGAGDSMVAAMVYCILHHKPLEETARWCSAAGTITASKPGTEVCSLEEVLAKLELVQITRI
ncbi:1-phosphofructokinase [Paenibacillus alkalitolerans]|uniref:1-phosphofructokinase n=1 Tax=Paenibacillus alkalitolerans TaxID=2799335 RepID=UPI0018F338E8|nr:1-phosphofructokinase [Paenibacillus alkalitolerans]